MLRAPLLFLVPIVAACAYAPPRRSITAAPDLCRQAPFCVAAHALEDQLRQAPLVVRASEPVSIGKNGARRALLVLPDGAVVRVKWKPIKRTAVGYENTRKELAAYALQKLFLDEEDYVVPPTVARCLPLQRYALEIDPAGAAPIFDGARCVLGVLAYWVEDVERLDGVDQARLRSDARYRRRIALLNLVTFLIDHRDTKPDNFAIARAGEPRAFALDNGMAFSGWRTPRGWFRREWQELVVDALPRATLSRALRLSRADLDRLLVVAELELRDGELAPVLPSEAIDPDRGVRRARGVLQLGLTRGEIDGIAERLRALRLRVESGELGVF